jgi:hypothetical protein
MATNLDRFDDAAATYERDMAVWQMLRAYEQPRDIARKLHCTIDEVHASGIRMSGGVTPDFRSRMMQLILEQVRDLQRAFHDKARKGDYDAATIELRGQDQICRMLGLYAPPMRDEPLDDLKPKRTSTEELRDVLNELIGKDCTIEGEVIKEEGDG